MKSVKTVHALMTVGLVMIALIAASNANAAQTDLCKVEESPCPAAPEDKRWPQGTNFEAKAEPLALLSGLGKVTCTSSTLKGPLGAGGSPQAVALESLVFVECKRQKVFGGTENCTVESLGLGGLDLLRTNFNLGEATLLNTEIRVLCGVVINCTYEGEPKFHLLGKTATEPAKLTASEVLLTAIAGAFCPETMKLDATYTIITPHPVYVME